MVTFPGVEVRVPLGEFAGATSPLRPPTALRLLDISLDADAELLMPVPAGHNAFVLPISGTLSVDGQVASSDGSPVPITVAKPHAHEIRLEATKGAAKVALFSGEPLNQPVYWDGPMALASPEALADAMAAFRRGDFGKL